MVTAWHAQPERRPTFPELLKVELDTDFKGAFDGNLNSVLLQKLEEYDVSSLPLGEDVTKNSPVASPNMSINNHNNNNNANADVNSAKNGGTDSKRRNTLNPDLLRNFQN